MEIWKKKSRMTSFICEFRGLRTSPGFAYLTFKHCIFQSDDSIMDAFSVH